MGRQSLRSTRAPGERTMEMLDCVMIATVIGLYGLLLWFADLPEGEREGKDGGRS